MIDADNLPISITCPVCGEKHDGNTDEIIEWRNEHRCRRPEVKVGISRIASRRAG